MSKSNVTRHILFAFSFFLFIQSATALKQPHHALRLDVAMSHPVILANRNQKAIVKVGLSGLESNNEQRSPVNLCLVLDKSGSMQGEKIRRAKEGAQMIVQMLGDRDIFSLVAYSNGVQVLVPATRMSEKEDVLSRIRAIRAGGSTALFGGVSKGLGEVRKFKSKDLVNRIILLSDGLANVGPSSPMALGRLGLSAGKEGIAITTIGLGLGYNEDLMTQLAMSSDGNHAFVENASDLAQIFNKELGDVLSVVAQDVQIKIKCSNGVRPLRVLDQDALIVGKQITLHYNQLYSNQEKYILLEVEVPKGRSGSKRQVALVNVAYANMNTNHREALHASTAVAYNTSSRVVQQRTNKKVMVQKTKAEANIRRGQAVELRDKGDIKGAESLLLQNFKEMQSGAVQFDDTSLAEESEKALKEVEEIKAPKKQWKKVRKTLRKKQHKEKTQSRY